MLVLILNNVTKLQQMEIQNISMNFYTSVHIIQILSIFSLLVHVVLDLVARSVGISGQNLIKNSRIRTQVY
mgnify:FL=1